MNQIRINKIIASVFFFLLLNAFVSTAHAQTASDSTVYTFLSLRDGNKAAGVLLSSDITTITVNDFTLGELHINKTQIITETDVRVGTAYCFNMKTGQEYCGKVVASDTVLSVETQSLGVIHIKPRLIKDVENVSPAGKGENSQWAENPQPYKYLFLPSAIPLKRHEGYYQNVMVLGNGINYGLTKNFSIGAMGVLAAYIPMGAMIYCKASTQVCKNFYAGGGIVAGSSFYSLGVGIASAYGVLTYGNTETNISLTAGYGYFHLDNYNYGSNSRNEWLLSKYPLLALSAMKRISKKLSLVSENWLFPMRSAHYNYSPYYYPPTYSYTYEYGGAISFGLKYFTGRSTFNFALVGLSNVNGRNFPFLILPYADYCLKFGG